jgi:DNA polymerase-3 subunit gamma/tau
MSYQVLARKYRPKNFDTLVGQEHVVRALTHALGSGRLHHAYLFTGTRGVGKTTLSRILAKSLNCIGPDGNGGITAEPCGQCDACRAIDAGRFVDYIEMDAASNRGVDEMAQLLEQAVYAPSNARFKVYMIDEVHMLTNHAFNSMLKTLEEPPEHVKFILATTDPQKIPVTVLSRCLQFNLKQMPPGHIVGHLENILGQEEVSFEQPARAQQVQMRVPMQAVQAAPDAPVRCSPGLQRRPRRPRQHAPPVLRCVARRRRPARRAVRRRPAPDGRPACATRSS